MTGLGRPRTSDAPPVRSDHRFTSPSLFPSWSGEGSIDAPPSTAAAVSQHATLRAKLVASLLGYRLRRWRSSETEQLVQEALARETWPVAQLRAWSMERVSELLHRAEHKVPYYRDLWSKRRQKGDNRSSEYLENWPILEKAAVRNHPRAFLADDCDVRRMRTTGTSGTTGTPLEFLESRESTRRWYALAEARWRRSLRGFVQRPVGDHRRKDGGAHTAEATAILGVESRPEPALHLFVPSGAGRDPRDPRCDRTIRHHLLVSIRPPSTNSPAAHAAWAVVSRSRWSFRRPSSVFDYQRVAIEDVFRSERLPHDRTRLHAASECEHRRYVYGLRPVGRSTTETKR